MRFETINLGIPGPQGVTGAPGADGPQGPPGPQGPAGTVLDGAVYHVDNIDAAKAIEGLTAGSIVVIGSDTFFVVDDATLGTDGGTVFIPDDQLSEPFEEVIPGSFFEGDVTTLLEYPLAHTGIDFESFELVVSDPNTLFPVTGEIIDIWTIMHGHMLYPGVTPRVLPKLKTAEGKFLDPYARLTLWLGPPVNPSYVHPPLRTGGALARYKYALSGLRLKRVTGPIFRLDWWPVVAIDEEAPGVQTDNSGKICWCINAAMAANAEAIFIPKTYYYGGVVEWPDGIEMRGRGPGISGFRVMDNYAFRELLLSTSADGAAANPALAPILKPATRQWVYDAQFMSSACTFIIQNNASRIRIRGVELDGNIGNNKRIFTQRNAEYAYAYAQSSIYLFNTITYAGFMVQDSGGRVIPAGCIIEIHDHVKIHGYSHIILGNINAAFIQTGTLEVGDCITGHWLYQCDGEFENVRCFGFVTLDGIRCHKFLAKSVEMILAPHPDEIFNLPVGDAYLPRTIVGLSTNEGSQFQSAATASNYPYPEPSPSRVVVDNLFIDATALDNIPAGKTYENMTIMSVGADNIHIGSGRLRLGSFNLLTSLFTSGLNLPPGLPIQNVIFENLHIEYGSRAGVQLYNSGVVGGFTQLTYRNITIEPRAATHMPGNPTPGTSVLLGTWYFAETPATGGIYDGYDFEFSAVAVDATLNGKYIDITPADPGAPMYRLWFNYNSLGSAPVAGGGTLVQVAVPSGATTAAVAAAFSNAIGGTTASPGVPSVYLTAATFKNVSAVGSFSNYHHEVGFGLITYSLSAAAGITAIARGYRRNYEPSYIGFERFVAADPTYISLLQLGTIGSHRDVYYRFKECILGSWNTSYVVVSGSGALHVAAVAAIKDQVHWVFEDTVFDCRDGTTWQNLDLFLYAGKFRNCRVRTPQVSTGLTTMATTGYDTLFSEDSGLYTGTPGAGVTTVDIQTKLFWVPKDGNVRIYPADPATAVVWNTNIPSVSWVKSARPISSTYTALGGSGAYYQGPAGISEDRRAPALRLTFATAPATALAIGWSAAVSP